MCVQEHKHRQRDKPQIRRELLGVRHEMGTGWLGKYSSELLDKMLQHIEDRKKQ